VEGALAMEGVPMADLQHWQILYRLPKSDCRGSTNARPGADLAAAACPDPTMVVDLGQR